MGSILSLAEKMNNQSMSDKYPQVIGINTLTGHKIHISFSNEFFIMTYRYLTAEEANESVKKSRIS